MSLYVADDGNDTISEYQIVSQIANNQIPNPTVTPSRVIAFNSANVKPGSVPNTGISCAPGPSGDGDGTAGVAVDPVSGTIYLLPHCYDASQTNGYIFGYSPQAVGTATPSIYDPYAGGYSGGAPISLAVQNSKLYAGYSGLNNTPGGLEILEYPVTSNEQQPSIELGLDCYNELGYSQSASPPFCFNTEASSYAGGFGVDANGYAYVPAAWTDTPNGDAASYLEPAAILAVPGSVQSSASTPTVPFSAIAGLFSNVGGSGQVPSSVYVDAAASTLYTLTGGQELEQPGTGTYYFPGLSECPPPTGPNAPFNQVDPSFSEVTQCADGNQHEYLASYSLTSQLLGSSAFGTDQDLIPNLLLGGDTVGRFGCPQYSGQFLAEYSGFVYVINQTGTNCSSGTLLPEIDVYNTNGLMLNGSYTNQAPVFVLPLHSGFPYAIAIGPSGTATGGQSLLRKLRSGPYRRSVFSRRGHPASQQIRLGH
jgi:hypothetical protein